jgi:eukaryotic-like serine/threonine-protein kinase
MLTKERGDVPEPVLDHFIAQSEDLVEATPELAGGGADPSDSKRSRIGETLAGRYLLQSKLGEGGMGVVYLAKQLQLNRTVVVKLISNRLKAHDPNLPKRFCLEASTLARVAHPHIVTIHDYGELGDGELFIAMEYVRGRSLDKVLAEDGPLPFERVIDIGIQIARALREAHANRVIHRDLKPTNIIAVDRRDEEDGYRIKVLDFGLAKLIEAEPGATHSGAPSDISRTAPLIGSPQYMSPEQVIHDRVDQRTDVYSLGLILFELASGAVPFRSESLAGVMHMHLTAAVPPLASVGYRRECPPRLEAIIRSCLEKLRDKRYATMNELLTDLKAIAASTSLIASSTPVGAVLPRFRVPELSSEVARPRPPSNPSAGSLYDSSPSQQVQPEENLDLAFERVIRDAERAVRAKGDTTQPELHFAAPSLSTSSTELVGLKAAKRSGAKGLLAVGAMIVGLAIGAVLLRSSYPPEPLALQTVPFDRSSRGVEEPPRDPAAAKAPEPSAPENAEVRVEFESAPAGARVRDGEEVLGVTPFARRFSRAGEPQQRSFVFELEGFVPTTVIAVMTGEALHVRAALTTAEAARPAKATSGGQGRRTRPQHAEHVHAAPVPAERNGAGTTPIKIEVPSVDDRKDQVRSVDETEATVVKLVD